eukprot:12424132-Karenia_brevis.AAC.1
MGYIQIGASSAGGHPRQIAASLPLPTGPPAIVGPPKRVASREIVQCGPICDGASPEKTLLRSLAVARYIRT